MVEIKTTKPAITFVYGRRGLDRVIDIVSREVPSRQDQSTKIYVEAQL